MLTRSINIYTVLLTFLSFALGQGVWPYGYGYNYNYGYGNGLSPYSSNYYSPNQFSKNPTQGAYYPPNQLSTKPTQQRNQIPSYSQQQLQQIAQQISDASRTRSGRGLSQSEIYQLTQELGKIQSIGHTKMQDRERKILFDTRDSRNSILNGYRSNIDLGEGDKDDRMIGLSFITGLISTFIPIGSTIISEGLPILIEIIKTGVPILLKILQTGTPIVIDIVKFFIETFA